MATGIGRRPNCQDQDRRTIRHGDPHSKIGTKLIDRPTRIDVIGVADDITVAELVEAVRRRGWSAVSVTGDAPFRRAVAWSMASADPPIEVINSPLTREGLADIDAMKAPSRWAVPEPPRPRMR